MGPVKLSLEVTKSPRGNLKANAEITGWVTVSYEPKEKKKKKAKPIEIRNLRVALVQSWMSPGKKMTLEEAKMRTMKSMDESESQYMARVKALMERPVPDENFTQQGDVFEILGKKEKVKLEAGESKRYEFQLKMPGTWSAKKKPDYDWHFAIVANLKRGRLKGATSPEIVVPVEGSHLEPSWYFEPLPEGGAGGAQAGMFEKPSSVGAFTVIPKGQKATIQIAKGANEGELAVTFQTPGVVRAASEFVQKVDPSLLERLMGRLEKITSALNVLRTADKDDPTLAKIEKAHLALKKFGHTLWLQVIPPSVQEGYKDLSCAVDFGLDESLVQYPWELMHNGEEFLCLRTPIGRFVASGSSDAALHFVERKQKNGVKFLLVVDPDGSLPGARKEGEAIMKALEEIEGVEVKLLQGEDADSIELLSELAEGYDFLHYSGHAVFDAENPENSGMLLADGLLKAYSLAGAVKSNPPILAFINACESGRQADWSAGQTEYENGVSGLSAAFLVNGINFIGPYWPVYDDAALMFSKNFYYAVLSGVPLGEAVMKAKKLIFDTFEGEEIAWASYSFFGDPTQTLEFAD
ncbi:MAG: CHAT domain-containing protein [Promethearchaeota archaeon]